MRLYDRVLSSAEIASLFHEPAAEARPVTPPGFEMVKFDELSHLTNDTTPRLTNLLGATESLIELRTEKSSEEDLAGGRLTVPVLGNGDVQVQLPVEYRRLSIGEQEEL